MTNFILFNFHLSNQIMYNFLICFQFHDFPNIKKTANGTKKRANKIDIIIDENILKIII